MAEIFSWYYPQEIEMHSYDNGTSLPSRQGNWSQLQRVSKAYKDLSFICKDSGSTKLNLYLKILTLDSNIWLYVAGGSRFSQYICIA